MFAGRSAHQAVSRLVGLPFQRVVGRTDEQLALDQGRRRTLLHRMCELVGQQMPPLPGLRLVTTMPEVQVAAAGKRLRPQRPRGVARPGVGMQTHAAQIVAEAAAQWLPQRLVQRLTLTPGAFDIVLHRRRRRPRPVTSLHHRIAGEQALHSGIAQVALELVNGPGAQCLMSGLAQRRLPEYRQRCGWIGSWRWRGGAAARQFH